MEGDKLAETLRFLKVLDDFLAGATLSAQSVEARCGSQALLLSQKIASARAASDALRVALQARIAELG